MEFLQELRCGIEVHEEYYALIKELSGYVDELLAVGCGVLEFMDFLVRFPFVLLERLAGRAGQS